MKIAFLNMYNGLVNRGAETFVKELALRLAVDHQVTIYQSGEISNSVYKTIIIPLKINLNKQRKDNLVSRLFLDYYNRLIFFFTLKSLPSIIKNNYDIVIPVNGGWQPALVRLVTWLSGKKMVISGQSGMGWDDRNNLWCFPDIFVALSKKAATWAKKVNPWIRVEYVPNGVDVKTFKPEGTKYHTKLKHPIVMCNAALTPAKRVDLTIKAVAETRNLSLLVVGDGEDREKILSLGNSLLGKDRFQLIKVPFEEVSSVYRSVDLFTLASKSYFSFEIVLVEAMASGVPVVANNDEIRQDIVGEAGLMVDPNDTQAYATALNTVLKKKWQDLPRKQALKFSWDKINSEYTKLILSINNQ